MECYIPSRGKVMTLPHGAISKIAKELDASHSWTTQLLLRGDKEAHELLKPLLPEELPQAATSQDDSSNPTEKKSRNSKPTKSNNAKENAHG